MTAIQGSIVRLCALLCVALAPTTDASAADVSERGWIAKPRDVRTLLRVSVMTLLLQPESFDQKAVRVIGVLSTEFEDCTLYMSTDAYEHYVKDYSIALEMTPKARQLSNKFQGKYVVVDGVFRLDKNVPGRLVIEVAVVEGLPLVRKTRLKE